MHTDTRSNIVVLTHGWTGSSVYTALFGEAGCWLGDATMRKPDYDTGENAELVALNRQLCATLMPSLDHEHRFDDEDVRQIERRALDIDLAPYAHFVARCGRQAPWAWKDPRLTWTIRIWGRLLDERRTAYLVLTREPLQAWITANTRRHVQSLSFTRRYNDGITRSNLRYLEERGLLHMQASFEDLLLAPERTLERLNGSFGLALTMADLRRVYRGPLGRRSRGWKDLLLATAIYTKNYRERDGRARLQRAATV